MLSPVKGMRSVAKAVSWIFANSITGLSLFSSTYIQDPGIASWICAVGKEVIWRNGLKHKSDTMSALMLQKYRFVRFVSTLIIQAPNTLSWCKSSTRRKTSICDSNCLFVCFMEMDEPINSTGRQKIQWYTIHQISCTILCWRLLWHPLDTVFCKVNSIWCRQLSILNSLCVQFRRTSPHSPSKCIRTPSFWWFLHRHHNRF